ncbi:MAG: V-type ATP synthase subunit I [Candidatus Nanohaloarchaea archaeon]|nr:V-type ATP synthase subunit I [Candidatus Nanohaloarchaea archaeon]
MIHPEDMTKVSILGPKSKMQQVIDRLHELEVLHIDEYDEDAESVDIGDPMEGAEEVSDQLVRIRSVKSQLPSDGTGGEGSAPDDIEELGERVDEIDAELEDVAAEQAEKQELLSTLHAARELGLDLDDFQDYRSIDIYLGTVDTTAFTDQLPDGRAEVYTAGDTAAVFADTELEVEDVLRDAGFDRIDHAPLVDMDGPITDAIADLEDEVQALAEREERLRNELQAISGSWRHELEQREAELSEELEKAEAPLSFATTDDAFIAEGWIPSDAYDDVAAAVEDAADGSIHIEELPEGEAPVKHDNPGPVKPMEDLLGVYGTPSYREVDPSFLLLTFPVLFGFMLGDIGYGLTTLAVFYGLYRKFPEAKGIWYSLMYASVATIAFGIVYGEMFGYIIFGHHSELAAATGLHVFEQIPILYHRTEHLGQVLTMSVIIGAVHVNLGFLVGAYNEYLHHGVKHAILAKLSWLVMEAGVVVWFLTGSAAAGAAIGLLGAVMVGLGEGVEGVVEIPSLVSNILSYLRVFGVVMAVIALAAVVNTLAEPLFQSGSILMITLGIGLLVVGHTFNTFLKLMESGLQGIRLHYVEFFTKFFEGGGEYYRPFGGDNV